MSASCCAKSDLQLWALTDRKNKKVLYVHKECLINTHLVATKEATCAIAHGEAGVGCVRVTATRI
jgi:hypothetical protein